MHPENPWHQGRPPGQAGNGANASSQVVELDAKGAGVARFGFDRQPGLQVVVGPADATDDES
jgi:hypothetical protein